MEKENRLIRPVDGGWIYLWATVGLAATPYLVRMFPGLLDTHEIVYTFLGYLISMGLPLLILKKTRRLSFSREIGLAPVSIGELFTSGAMALAAYPVILFLNFLWTLLLDALGVPPLPDPPLSLDTGWHCFLTLVSVALLPAFFEESVMRGVVQTALRPYGTRRAVWCTAILFGLLHMNLHMVLYATLLGALMGALTVRTGSVMPGMTFHFVNNALGVLLSAMLPEAEAAAEEIEYTAADLWQTGLSAGLTALIGIGLLAALWLLLDRQVKRRGAVRAQYAERPRTRWFVVLFAAGCAVCIEQIILGW